MSARDDVYFSEVAVMHHDTDCAHYYGKPCDCGYVRQAAVNAVENPHVVEPAPGYEKPEVLKGNPNSVAKDTNPKDAVGIKKVPYSTVSMVVVGEVALAMLEGARKYGRHNYRIAGVRASVYFDAAMRHLTAWWEGQDIDPDSGMSHIVKALSTLFVLRDAMHNDKWTDDRPPSVINQEWVSELNAKAAEIIERYKDARPPFTIADKIKGE